jgi:cytochrome c553
MWDGREPSPITSGLTAALNHLGTDAAVAHFQLINLPTQAQLDDMTSFQEGLYTAQESDTVIGPLTSNGATEAAENLTSVPFFYGVNQVPRPTFNLNVFTFFSAWSSLAGTDPVSLAEESVVRGETLFNTKQMKVGPNPRNLSHCAGCHNDPSVGNNSNNPILMTHQGSDAPNDPLLQTISCLPEFSIGCPGENQPKTLRLIPVRC